VNELVECRGHGPQQMGNKKIWDTVGIRVKTRLTHTDAFILYPLPPLPQIPVKDLTVRMTRSRSMYEARTPLKMAARGTAIAWEVFKSRSV
jgi:hypothetical protein